MNGMEWNRITGLKKSVLKDDRDLFKCRCEGEAIERGVENAGQMETTAESRYPRWRERCRPNTPGGTLSPPQGQERLGQDADASVDPAAGEKRWWWFGMLRADFYSFLRIRRSSYPRGIEGVGREGVGAGGQRQRFETASLQNRNDS